MRPALEIFSEYARERRHAHIPGYVLDAGADVTRHFPKGPDEDAILSFARFDPALADGRIDAELAALRRRGCECEWKVHDFDEPADLRARLGARGLRAHHTEALMVLDVAAAPLPSIREDDIVVESAHGETLERIAALQEEVWDIRLPWLNDSLREMADPVTGSALVLYARHGDAVVGTGWIDFQGGSPFAQLCGGAVLPAYRGRGVYSRLYGQRLAEAKARGVRWIAVDAAPMSRPILEKKGFRFVCHTYPMRTKPYDAGAVTRA